jgi:hypothetical protein
MSRLSISKAWEEARGVLRSDGKLLTTLALALILLPQTISGALAPPKELTGQDPPGWAGLLALIVGLIGIVAQIALVRLALHRGTSVGEAISRGVKRFLPAFLAIFLFMLVATAILVAVMALVAGTGDVQLLASGTVPPRLGWLLLILLLALLLVGVRLQMVLPAASEEEGGPLYLLKRSWRLTAGNYWRLFAFLLLIVIAAVILMAVAGMIGGILVRALFGDIEPLSLGALVVALIAAAAQAAFSVIITAMLARIYAQLAGGEPDQLVEPSVPSSSGT